MPWVEDVDATRQKIGGVSCDNGHAVNQGGRGDETVGQGLDCWNVKLRAAQCNRTIDRQHPAIKGRQDMAIKPFSKHGPLKRVAALQAEHANFKFVDSNHRHIEIGNIHAVSPPRDRCIGFTQGHLAQF